MSQNGKILHNQDQLSVNKKDYISKTPSHRSLGTDLRNNTRSNMGLTSEESLHFLEIYQIEQIYTQIYDLPINSGQLSKNEQSLNLLKESNIKHLTYQHAYLSELKKMKKKFWHFKRQTIEKQYQRLLLCFWIAVHQEKDIVVKFLYNRYEIIQYLVQHLYGQANQQRDKILKEIVQRQLYFQQNDQKEVALIIDNLKNPINDQYNYITPDFIKVKSKLATNLDFFPQEIRETLKSKSEINKSVNSDARSGEISPFQSDQEEKQVRERMISENRQMIELNVREVKLLLMSSLGTGICTSILHIALNDEEFMIAHVISVYYKVQISKQCLYRMVAVKDIAFFKLLFSTDKFIRDQENFLSNELLSTSQKAKSPLIMKSFISMIVSFRQDEFIEKNPDQINGDLLKEQAPKYREMFVVKCIEVKAEIKKTLSDPIIVNYIVQNLQKQGKIFYVLMLLNYANLRDWPIPNINELMAAMHQITVDEYEKNMITAVHNPLLAIALVCEIMTKLHHTHSYLKNQCAQTQKKLIQLVQKIIDSQDDQQVLEQMLTEFDHRKNSALSIINNLGLTQMICSPKVNAILTELWIGKENQKYNGKLMDFSCIISRFMDPLDQSNVSFIYDNQGRKTISNKLGFWNIVYGSFVKPKIKEQNYWFQYSFRHFSIDYIYWKEFTLSFFLVVIFQYISYTYLSYFKLQNIQINGWVRQDVFEDNDPAMIQYVESLISQYQQWAMFGITLCSFIFLHFFQKLIFSLISGKKLSLDLWTQIDILTAICNYFCLQVTQSATAREILNKLSKQNLDFYVCAVVTITWFRFFNYFLVIKKISKLLITLVTMITNTMSFIFMFVCYMIIAAVIFTMRFGDVNSDMFGDFFTSARSLFDAMESNYTYVDFGVYQRSFDMFFIIHLILTKIFFLNYLVAVLTTIYQFMIIQGEYNYIRLRFSYYKRFQNMFKTKKHFDQKGKNCIENSFCELAMHPSPENIIVCFLSAASLPLFLKQELRLKIFQFISYFIYWTENLMFTFVFFGIDLTFAIMVYFKIQMIFIMKVVQKRKAVLFAIYWFFTGIFIMIYLALGDTLNFMRILVRTKDKEKKEKEKMKKAKDKHLRQLQISILNEVIESMRELYQEIEMEQKVNQKRKMSSNQQLLSFQKTKEDLVKKLKDLKKEVLTQQKMDTSFTIDKDLIIMTWLKLRKNRIQQARMKQQSFSTTKQRLRMSDRKSAVYFPQTTKTNLMGVSSNMSLRPSPTLMMGKKYVQQALEQNAKRRRSSMPRNPQSKYSINKFIKDFNKRQSNSSKRKSMLSRRRMNSSFRSQRHLQYSSNIFSYEGEQEQELKIQTAVDEQLLELIENFLNKFIFVSKYQGHNQVNLKLCLSALPFKLTNENFYRIQMINFVKVQMAMVAFQNQKSDQLFNYYDTRNKARIHQLNYQAADTSDISRELLQLSLSTKNKLVKLFKLEREFNKIEKKRKQEKDVFIINIQQHPDIKKSTNTVTTDKTTSLFPVVEESEYGEYDLRQSNFNSSQANKKNSANNNSGNSGNFKFEKQSNSSTLENQGNQIEFQESQSQINNSQRRSYIDQSMEYSIQQSQEENQQETNSNSSFTSFSDIIKEETESNLSSNNEEQKSSLSQKF